MNEPYSASHERGVALASVLFFLLGLVTLSATLFFTTYLDGEAARNVWAGTGALYVADAGIQHLRSLLVPAPDFSAELAWPDGAPPFDSPAWFPEPPQTYRVRVSEGADGSLRALSEGTSHRGARARVEATFRRETPFHPAASLLASGTIRSAAVRGGLEVTGSDRDGVEPRIPPLAGENRSSAEVLRSALSPPESVIIAGPCGMEEAIGKLRAAADRTLTGPFQGGAWGSAEAPEVVRLSANAEVYGEATAAGILIADAPLRVYGRLEVEGLLLAPAGLEVDGSLEIHGSLWLGEDLGVADSGGLRVDYSSAALDRADRLRPATLPRAAVLGGWREVW